MDIVLNSQVRLTNSDGKRRTFGYEGGMTID